MPIHRRERRSDRDSLSQGSVSYSPASRKVRSEIGTCTSPHPSRSRLWRVFAAPNILGRETGGPGSTVDQPHGSQHTLRCAQHVNNFRCETKRSGPSAPDASRTPLQRTETASSCLRNTEIYSVDKQCWSLPHSNTHAFEHLRPGCELGALSLVHVGASRYCSLFWSISTKWAGSRTRLTQPLASPPLLHTDVPQSTFCLRKRSAVVGAQESGSEGFNA